MTLLLIISAFCFSFIIVLITVPSVISVAKRKRLFDNNNERKTHNGIVPPLGGAAIFLGFALSSIIFTDGYFSITLKYLIASSILIFFFGVTDDLINISAKKKVLGQLLAVLILYIYGDVQITDCHGLFGIFKINEFCSLLITVFLMLAIINSFNLIDGIDGLASGLAIVSSTLFGIWFILAGHFQLSVISFSLTGSLCGFFIFNVFGKKKKLFMGDTGSMIVGLIIAILAVKYNELNTNKEIVYYVEAAPAVSFSFVIVPMIDTLRVITIRLLDKKSPFTADRNHIHHRLLSLYPNHLKVTLILIISNIVLAGIEIMNTNLSYSDVTTQFLIIFLLGIMLSFLPSYLLRKKETEKHKKFELSHESNNYRH